MLEYFENGGKWQLGGLYYRLKLLETGGFMPRLRSCGRCGKHSGLFHFCHGTVLCDECSMHEKTSVRVSPAAVALFSTMTKWDFSNIERLRPSEGILAELVSLIEMHISHITERDTASVIA
jgi:DNA repair protein RecO